MTALDKSWIDQHCKTSTGNLNNRCARDSWWLIRGFDHHLQTLKEVSPNLTEALYRVYNVISEQPMCTVCGAAPLPFVNFKDGYRTACSLQCATQHNGRRAKISAANLSNVETRIAKSKQTCIERYQTSSFRSTQMCVDQIKQTKLDRYGNPNYNNTNRTVEVDVDYVYHQHNVLKRSYQEIARDLGCSDTVISCRMREAGFSGTRFSQQSSYERELHQFLTDHGVHSILSDRATVKHVEMDLYIPSHKLAIEVNGVYWHEQERRPRHHLVDKQATLAAHGIRVINIWDGELDRQLPIVHSLIKTTLGIVDNRLYARQCQIVELSGDKYQEFLRANHIQGAVQSSIRLGLVYRGNVVMVMGVGKSRYQPNQYELHRLCSSLNTVVVGGASKLFKQVIKRVPGCSIVSYCDKRWFTGEVYDRLGFTLSHTSPPNYFYFRHNNVLRSRLQFQKHKLRGLLDDFDPMATEYENMKANGFKRVFDCGNGVYVFNTTDK